MLKMKCPEHPNYNGSDPPRCSCDTCCSIWTFARKAVSSGAVIVFPKTRVRAEEITAGYRGGETPPQIATPVGFCGETAVSIR